MTINPGYFSGMDSWRGKLARTLTRYLLLANAEHSSDWLWKHWGLRAEMRGSCSWDCRRATGSLHRCASCWTASLIFEAGQTETPGEMSDRVLFMVRKYTKVGICGIEAVS